MARPLPFRWFLPAALFFSPLLQAAIPPLLDAAVQKWAEGKNDWAFTQRTRTIDDGGKIRDERVERYDPSLPDAQRWHLLEYNGKPPTDAQRAQFQDRKNKRPRKHANKPLGDLFDFDQARLLHETSAEATYAVDVRPESARLVQVEKLMVEVTVSKQDKMIERVTGSLREPARVALGLAKILDVDLDVHFETPAEEKPGTSSDVQASGTARVLMSKMGDRAEYVWSDFKRVTRHEGGGGAAENDGRAKATTGEAAPEAAGEESRPAPGRGAKSSAGPRDGRIRFSGFWVFAGSAMRINPDIIHGGLSEAAVVFRGTGKGIRGFELAPRGDVVADSCDVVCVF